MPDDALQAQDREQRLDEAVTAFLEEQESGHRLRREEWLARYPEVAAELEQFFADQDEVDNLARPLRRALQDAPPKDTPRSEPLDGTLYRQALAHAEAIHATDPGGCLGDFRIVREVGKGGMGVVYEAEQISLRRRVALKVLAFAATLDARHLQRFHNEAQAAACLHHTNIVPVFSVGCERGVHFYAMQFIDGQPLSELIRQMRDLEKKDPITRREQTTAYQAPLPVAAVTPLTSEARRSRDYFRKVAEIGMQAAEALDHAHQLGIVHRDIKPANLLLDGTGRVWITDFGLAHMQHGEASLTLTGQTVGTPRYMSPEQALAKRVPIDHRTDVYSLGVTLYELLTLRQAFASEDRQQLLHQIAFDDPSSPRRLERAIPAELEIIVLKAMEKRPQDRYATAQELADDLRRFLEHRPITARRPTLRQRVGKALRRHRAVATAAAVGLFVAAVVLAISTVWVTIENREKETALQEARRNLELVIRQRQYSRDALKIATDQMQSAQNLLDRDLQNGGSRRDALDTTRKLADVWEKFVNVDPIHPTYRDSLYETQLIVGTLWWQEGDAAQAAEAFARAVATAEKIDAMNPWSPLGDPSKTESRKVSRIQLARALNSLGIACRDCGRYSEGVTSLEEAADIYRNLADYFLNEAVEFIRRNVRAGPKDKEAARMLTKKGEKEMFSLTLKRAEAETRIELAELLTEAGRPTEAQTALDEAARILKSIPPNRSLPLSRFQFLPPLTLLEGKRRLAQANLDWKANRRDKAEAEYREVRTMWEATNEKSDRELRREFAWLLCTCPVPDVRAPHQAVRLMETTEKMEAELAKDQKEKNPFRMKRPGEYWLALGAAHYFVGDAKAAAEALERAYYANFTLRKFPPGHDLSKILSTGQTAYDYFLFAMSKAKLGDKEQARRWFDLGVAWMEKNRPRCDELLRFRAEAAIVLDIKETSAVKIKERLHQKP